MSSRYRPNSKFPSRAMAEKAFAPLMRTLDQLATGTIDSVKGRPVHVERSGNWCDIVTSARALVSGMERINPEVKYPSLEKMLARLDAGMLLQESDITGARQDALRMKQIYLKSRNSHIVSCMRTEMIAIELTEGAPA